MTAPASTATLDAIDQQILNEMQDKFPLIREPFAELAQRAGIGEDEAMERIGAMRESGVLRQVSPIFDTKALGYSTSLVAMSVPDEKLKRAAKIINDHPGVSHNYKRTHHFNMWFTIAVPAGSDLQAHVDALHRLAGADSTRMLPTLRLYKIGVTLDMTGERAMDDKSTPQYTHDDREKAASSTLTPRDIDVVRAVQGDLPLERDPFAAAARALGTTVDGLIEELQVVARRRRADVALELLQRLRPLFGLDPHPEVGVRPQPDDAVAQLPRRDRRREHVRQLVERARPRREVERAPRVREAIERPAHVLAPRVVARLVDLRHAPSPPPHRARCYRAPTLRTRA
jgi:DNA-binding Lrp family transcriptional regulator